jgi:hypothetical protein
MEYAPLFEHTGERHRARQKRPVPHRWLVTTDGSRRSPGCPLLGLYLLAGAVSAPALKITHGQRPKQQQCRPTNSGEVVQPRMDAKSKGPERPAPNRSDVPRRAHSRAGRKEPMVRPPHCRCGSPTRRRRGSVGANRKESAEPPVQSGRLRGRARRSQARPRAMGLESVRYLRRGCRASGDRSDHAL